MRTKAFHGIGLGLPDASRLIDFGFAKCILRTIFCFKLFFAGLLFLAADELAAISAEGFTVSWTNNMLTVTGAKLPGNTLEIWFLEAFCRSKSTHQDWSKTTIPHKTRLVNSTPNLLRFRTVVSTNMMVYHQVKAAGDELEFAFEIKNVGLTPVDLEWFQPACIRVGRFTGLNQSNYISRSFLFTEQGLTTLDKTRRREEAIYRGGQVYVPNGINLNDVNPRPISETKPVNGLIGCFSADDQYLLATASDQTHELFEGVIVCLHSDPHVGGLKPGETKKVRSKLYFMRNDPEALLKKYRQDFPDASVREKPFAQ